MIHSGQKKCPESFLFLHRTRLKRDEDRVERSNTRVGGWGGRRGRCWLNRLHSGFTLTSWIKAVLQTAAVTHCACVCGYMEVNEGPTKRDLGEGNPFFFFFFF